MTNNELLYHLHSFTGTEQYHRFSPLFNAVVLTDGAKYLADEAGAYWLMDMIASHLGAVPSQENFVIALLTKEGVNEPGALFTLQDDIPPNNIWAEQDIEYTDFPLDEIKLYVVDSEVGWVVMLPSEY